MKYHKKLKPIPKKQIILDTYYNNCKEYSMEEIAGVFNITKQYLSLLVIADKERSQARRLLGVE